MDTLDITEMFLHESQVFLENPIPDYVRFVFLVHPAGS